MRSTGPLTVIGLIGGEPFGAAAYQALAAASVVVGSKRHRVRLDLKPEVEQIDLSDLTDALGAIAGCRADGKPVVVLASGDPSFFGIVRVLGERFGPDGLAVLPAPSSVALSFARIGVNWDDAVVVSAHGRPLAPVAATVARSAKAAVLTSPENRPEALGQALLELGVARRRAVVISRIGEDDESFSDIDVAALASERFDPMSVVLLLAEGDTAMGASFNAPAAAFGRNETEFEHRDGMITKAEIRAVSLSKLSGATGGVLWDVGAGSGSVAIEAAQLWPGMRVIAIERDLEQAARIEANASRHGVAVEVISDRAPAALDDLPDPDRVFIGGGGMEVLDAVLGRLREGGIIVANYALIGRADEAHRRLGNMVHLSVSRAVPVGDLGARFEAYNPVFVCWGPTGARP